MSNIVKKEQSNLIKQDSGIQYQKLIELAISSNADIDKLERLMDLQERWEAKEAKKSFIEALARFQSQCPTIKKSKEGYNFKYAPMEDVISQVGQLLADCGLSYRFEQDQKLGMIGITCVSTHINGHQEKLRIEAEHDTGAGRNKIQAIGSTITYLKRYSFLGAFGIATADEDTDARLEKVQGDFLSDEQISTVEGLLSSVDANREKFLAFFKTKEVADLKTNQYNQAVSMLKSKVAK